MARQPHLRRSTLRICVGSRRLELGARLSSLHQGGPPFRTWVNLAAAWVLILGSLVLAVAVFAMDARDAALRDRGLTARATLLEVHTGTRGTHAYVIAEYPTAGGRLVTAEVDTFEMHPAPHAGDTATVLYDPRHPASNVVDARLGPDTTTTWFLTGVSIVSGALVVPTLRRGLNWDDLGA